MVGQTSVKGKGISDVAPAPRSRAPPRAPTGARASRGAALGLRRRGCTGLLPGAERSRLCPCPGLLDHFSRDATWPHRQRTPCPHRAAPPPASSAATLARSPLPPRCLRLERKQPPSAIKPTDPHPACKAERRCRCHCHHRGVPMLARFHSRSTFPTSSLGPARATRATPSLVPAKTSPEPSSLRPPLPHAITGATPTPTPATN
jgi:hypothetical protein